MKADSCQPVFYKIWRETASKGDFAQNVVELTAAAGQLAERLVDAVRLEHPVFAGDGRPRRGAEEKLGFGKERLIIHLGAPGVNRHAAQDGAANGQLFRVRAPERRIPL